MLSPPLILLFLVLGAVSTYSPPGSTAPVSHQSIEVDTTFASHPSVQLWKRAEVVKQQQQQQQQSKPVVAVGQDAKLHRRGLGGALGRFFRAAATKLGNAARRALGRPVPTPNRPPRAPVDPANRFRHRYSLERLANSLTQAETEFTNRCIRRLVSYQARLCVLA